jgi:chloramphenicol 3-O phosphotransferase
MDRGHIILLNGTSSSGKTTIAKALQESLSEPYMHISGDHFLDMLPEWFWSPTEQEEAVARMRLIPAIISGLHRCVVALAESGINLIVDHVLQEIEWLEECVENWGRLDVLFVGVRCPLEVAEQREKERDDRNMGTARYQYERVHAHGLYDVEVDTSTLTVDECVTRITELVKKKPTKTAFREIENRFAAKASSISKAKRNAIRP